MKLSSFRVGNTPGVRSTDFHIGRYCLAKHFATSAMNAIDASTKYARQLLLTEPSDFPSGRVPIFVCECCAGLDCGATTVAVKIGDGVVTWQDFRMEAPYDEGRVVSEVYARTGPFHFDLVDYRSALLPYTRHR